MQISRLELRDGAVEYTNAETGEKIVVRMDRVAIVEAGGTAEEQWARVLAAKEEAKTPSPGQERTEAEELNIEFENHRGAPDH